jgi:hypothetical protein
MNFAKLQDDDYQLFYFIKDKYERRRYTKTKIKDPMSLIYEGKEPEEEEEVKNKKKLNSDVER